MQSRTCGLSVPSAVWFGGKMAECGPWTDRSHLWGTSTPSWPASSPLRYSGETARSVVEELRELRDIARREHGPNARSTRHIEECLDDEERRAKERKTSEGSGSRERA